MPTLHSAASQAGERFSGARAAALAPARGAAGGLVASGDNIAPAGSARLGSATANGSTRQLLPMVT